MIIEYLAIFIMGFFIVLSKGCIAYAKALFRTGFLFFLLQQRKKRTVSCACKGAWRRGEVLDAGMRDGFQLPSQCQRY